jgi:hypothetical protein
MGQRSKTRKVFRRASRELGDFVVDALAQFAGQVLSRGVEHITERHRALTANDRRASSGTAAPRLRKALLKPTRNSGRERKAATHQTKSKD